jgi:pimeloyl-ACP methyl ester carboxylesterase
VSRISPTPEEGRPKAQNQATYVLVHGAWHGSWCWKRVRKNLQDAGHQVFTPTLTGLGERSHLNSAAVNLSTHVADVANLFRWEDLSDVILCGHSYGGNVISGVADQVPERIRTLVYLDAFVPEDGESLFDLHSPEGGRNKCACRHKWQATGGLSLRFRPSVSTLTHGMQTG